MQIREQPLEELRFYHIYNRGINGQPIFLNDNHYKFFLKKTEKYLLSYFDIYAYCLMRNHFHFLLRTKELDPDIFPKSNGNTQGLHSEHHVYSKQLGKLISSYTQAFNKVEKRHGPLLESPFKRLKVDSERYLRNLIIYIHRNSLDIGIAVTNYEYYSYKSIISNQKTVLKSKEVISYFDDDENFKLCHKERVDLDSF
ncbi:hypothetical protein EIB71_02660 [Kaistella daneshvariae]|uniref:Transposase IS200-like domain-containing protein n=1 Tax=Kaistella daneshvariae TaxID=2487074 RepID=A0ABM7C6Q6_9FLAO|nr:hypothetical protein [Kaistella daneshvariae]AZI66648.1 hypothetical protein EIB71_02660 [Kaistella daneshvariae]